MSVRLQTTSHPGPRIGNFSFSQETKTQVDRILARYPDDRKASGILPLLDLAQRENGGWLSREAQDYVASLCEVAPIRVYEVASFYSMFYTHPVGKHVVQVCRTTTCWLRGSDGLTACAKRKLGIELGQTDEQGVFTLVEVECLGACANAPMVQINDDYYEDLDVPGFEKVLADLVTGTKPKAGSQTKRLSSAPDGGPTALVDFDPTQDRPKELADFRPLEST